MLRKKAFVWEAQALVTRPSSHPLLDNTSPYLHIETLGAISKKILIDPFWDIFFSLSKYKINTV